VIITDLSQPWYGKHFLGARRVVGSWTNEERKENGLVGRGVK